MQNMSVKKKQVLGFPGGAVVKNPPANAGDTGSSPGPGRSHIKKKKKRKKKQVLFSLLVVSHLEDRKVNRW